MSSPPSEHGPGALVTVGKFRSIETEIQNFESEYPGWLDHEHPVYRLPAKVIETLGKGRGRKPPFLSPSEKLTELNFSILCDDLWAVGIWRGRPIQYRYLEAPTPAPKRNRIRGPGWSDTQMAQVEQKLADTEDIRLRLRGYVGWLLTSPDCIEGRDSLIEQWNRLDEPERPGFPLQRMIRLEQPPSDASQAGAAVCKFQRDVNAFLDHWGLLHFVTWDLPEPQGPLIPAPMSPDAQSMPQHGVHMVLPTHYPMQGSDGILREIQRQQIELARQNGLDTSLAGLPHHKVYGEMLEVDHFERAVRSRYREKARQAGFVGFLEGALADHLDYTPSNVKRLRKGISACKRGKRETVYWLRRCAGLLT